MTEHSGQILAGAWPSQLVTTWSGYAAQYSSAAEVLFGQVQVQHTLQEILAAMSGAFIEAARTLVAGRRIVLENRVAAYRFAVGKAQWAANEIHATKADLIEIVTKAEEEIAAARERAEKLKAAPYLAGRAAAIEALLQSEIAKIVATAQTSAQARDAEGASTVSALVNDLKNWTQPHTPMTLPTAGGPGRVPAAPAPRAPDTGDVPTRTVDFTRPSFADRPAEGQTSESEPTSETRTDPAAFKKPDSTDVAREAPRHTPKHAATPSMPSPSPPAASTGGASSAGGPGSMLGQLMNPLSSSSPVSTLSSSTGGMPGANSPLGTTGSGVGTNPGLGVASTPGGNVGLDRALSAVGTSTGIAEASARMTSGAVSAATNVVSGAVNAGTQAAQAAATAATSAAAAPSMGPQPGSTALPMMAPPAAVGAGTPVTGGPPAPGGPSGPNVGSGPPPTASPAGAQTQLAGVGAPGGPPAGAAAPLFMNGSPVAALGADGVDGEELVARAVEVSQAVVTTLIAQTRAAGYIGIDWALALIAERSGAVSAWLASSEGPSYIPLGVRIPEDVGVAVADPVIGRGLWETTGSAGGGNPLEVLVQHARQRDAATPGARVLALASSLPLGRVTDWAAMVGARPVSVDAKSVEPAGAAELGDALVHRCAVAMPWEWRQANAFTDRERLQIAARHMRMAAVSGHLAASACDQAMRLFEQGKQISAQLWKAVQAERIDAMVAYQLADQMRHQGGGVDPGQAFRASRAAEVVYCLRNFDTVEGCADILYASRLAGAPLNPAVAQR